LYKTKIKGCKDKTSKAMQQSKAAKRINVAGVTGLQG